MNESPDQILYKKVDDPTPPVLGEIRVDADGNHWKWVHAHHTKTEEADIESDMVHFWDRHLQKISDDADAEAAERNGIDHKDVEDENDVAGRWQAMG